MEDSLIRINIDTGVFCNCAKCLGKGAYFVEKELRLFEGEMKMKWLIGICTIVVTLFVVIGRVNGNLLVTEFYGERVNEVDDSGTIVWEMTGLNHPVDVEIVGSPLPYQVEIDIKPGSYPNSINLGNNGVIPVAILSSWEFDATTAQQSKARTKSILYRSKPRERV